jgi:Fur family peroxide stress response transcriptional regulator
MNVAKKIEELKAYCKENSIPLTQQRLEVYRSLVWTDEHPSPEEIYKELRERYPTISLATVYKNLEALSNIGFARKINPLSDRARYDADLTLHSHFVCTSCVTVYDVHSDQVNPDDIPDLKDTNHEVTGKYIQYIGICEKCKNNTQEEK